MSILLLARACSSCDRPRETVTLSRASAAWSYDGKGVSLAPVFNALVGYDGRFDVCHFQARSKLEAAKSFSFRFFRPPLVTKPGSLIYLL